MLSKLTPWIMGVSGALTLTMLYAALNPIGASETMFDQTPDGALASVVVPNWGVLIGLMGALLIWGAYRPAVRRTALVVAGASKLAFVALVLAQGETYLDGVGIAVAVDSVVIVLFALILLFTRPA